MLRFHRLTSHKNNLIIYDFFGAAGSVPMSSFCTSLRIAKCSHTKKLRGFRPRNFFFSKPIHRSPFRSPGGVRCRRNPYLRQPQKSEYLEFYISYFPKFCSYKLDLRSDREERTSVVGVNSCPVGCATIDIVVEVVGTDNIPVYNGYAVSI